MAAAWVRLLGRDVQHGGSAPRESGTRRITIASWIVHLPQCRDAYALVVVTSPEMKALLAGSRQSALH